MRSGKQTSAVYRAWICWATWGVAMTWGTVQSEGRQPAKQTSAVCRAWVCWPPCGIKTGEAAAGPNGWLGRIEGTPKRLLVS